MSNENFSIVASKLVVNMLFHLTELLFRNKLLSAMPHAAMIVETLNMEELLTETLQIVL